MGSNSPDLVKSLRICPVEKIATIFSSLITGKKKARRVSIRREK
jgi:hypothetical protein